MTARRDRMQQDLDDVTYQLNDAQAVADEANNRVIELTREQTALQSAIDIMDGKELVKPAAPIFFPLQGKDARFVPSPLPVAPTGAQYAKLNGEDILLEPGMRVGRNSFGEEVLVPIDSIDPPLMAEPEKPVANLTNILPPLGTTDSFGEDPNEMFS